MSPFVFFVFIFVLSVFGFCNGSGHACLWWRNPSCAYFSACWPGLLRVSRGNCFFAIYLEPWFFFFTLMRFHPNNFSEYFRQTTKNGSKGAFSVLSPCVVFVLFLSSSFLVLRWLWPRMLVVPKPKLFVFLGLLAWFAVSVTLRRFFLPIYLEPWFFFFTLTTMFQNFLDTQHRTAPRGLFRFCCERCGSQVFALCTTWSAVAGQSALVAGGCLLFDARTWLGSGRPGRTDQTVSLFQCPFCSCVLGIVFSCFLDLHYLVLLCRNGSTSNGGSTEGCGTGISASNATVTCGAPTAGLQTGTAGPAACRAPGYRPENSLSGNPLLSWRPARISVFRVPPWGRQLETFFRVCTNEIQLSLERSPHQNLTPIDVERETL